MNISFLKPYIYALVGFLILDGLWLGVVARPLYQAQIGFMLRKETLWPAAAAFYLIYIAGLVFFVIAPGIREGTLGQAALRGALFGFFTYATYDLTNLATVEGWPLLISIVDITWGTTLCTATTLFSVWLGKL